MNCDVGKATERLEDARRTTKSVYNKSNLNIGGENSQKADILSHICVTLGSVG